MLVIVDNELTIEKPTQRLKEYCKKNLVLDNPEYINAIKRNSYGARYIDKKLYLYRKEGDKYILPFGAFRDVVLLSGEGTSFRNAIHVSKPIEIKSNINLYDYQRKALEVLKRAKSGVLVAGCGAGKTQIGLQLIAELGGRALWLTHTNDLLQQSYERAKNTLDCPLGKITGGKVDIQHVTFATVQTMVKLDLRDYKNKFDIIIVDECHHAVGSPSKMKMFYKCISNLSARFKYGLTATPTRSDGLTQAMYALIGGKVHEITRESIGEKIVLSEYKEIFFDSEPKGTLIGKDIITGEPTYKKDYINSDGTYNYSKLISTLSNWEDRNNIIVSLVNKNPDRHILILCNLVSHAKRLASVLDAELLIGSKTKKDRKSSIERLKSGKSKVVVATVSLVKEGLDIPILDTLIFASPQKNDTIITQSMGRIERSCVDKLQPVVYDIVDTKIPYCMGSYKKRLRVIKRRSK